MTEEPFSPVCYSGEADDAYMGFAAREDVLAQLNELLEAERAGAQVARAGTSCEHPEYAELMKTVHRAEAIWCAMLTRQIIRLQGEPSQATGGFKEKALGIPDPIDRLKFLNRGQEWVVRKLERLMPTVRDDTLHRDLSEMMDSHRRNIQRADEVIRSLRDGG